MKITILIIGLALAAVVGLQSFAILTNPFTDSALSGPASLGIMVALLLVVASAFAMSVLRVSIGCFGVAGGTALVAGMSTGFHDLRLWGFVALGLAVLSFLAHRGNRPARTSGRPLFEFGSYQQPPAGFELATETPITVRATQATAPDTAFRPVAAPPAAETDIIERLERLTALRSAGSLSDEEFASMKSMLMATPAKDLK